MKYADIIEEIQKKEKNRIIIVKCGAFFVSLGKDAVILNKLLGLKLTCQKERLCKVGIPVNYIIKYVDKLEEKGYSFSIYDYSREDKKINLEYSFDGKKCNCTISSLDCSNCKSFNPWKSTEQRNIYKMLTERKKNNGRGT